MRFVCFQDKITLLQNSRPLRDKGIYLHDDYPPEVAAKRAALRPLLHHLKKQDPDAKLILDKIKFQGKLYTIDSIKDSTANLQGLGTYSSDNHIFFAGEGAPLSNLYPCKISSDGGTFASAEHMYQYLKCRALDDHSTARKILLITSPRDAMLEGKSVKTSREWCESQGADIMKKVIAAKYNQVPQFRDLVEANSDKSFVEASRHPIWGCGIPLSSTTELDNGEFPGRNLMGDLLQRFAQELEITH